MTDATETPARFPRRAANKAATRAKIKAAATALFRDVGYAAATIRGIAAKAKMSTGAVFANWENKEAIWQEIMGLPAPRDGALYRAGPDLLEALERAVVEMEQFCGAHSRAEIDEARAAIASATTPLPFEEAADAG